MSEFQRKIIHVDMDCFFAAVEMRDNPKLRNVPLAVGGFQDRRGVLCTCNYEARKYGVRSAMPTAYAKKLCPNLVIVPPNGAKYKEASEKVHKVFREFTDIIQPLSLDEAYLDVTQSDKCYGSATLMAKEIRKRIFEETHLTASAGVAPNKFLAKVASDINKPNGICIVSPTDVEEFVKQLPVEKIGGVGKVTLSKLHKVGIKTCLDVQKQSLENLVFHFGKFGQQLYLLARGIDSSEVKTNHVPKSLSVERTFAEDIPSKDDMQLAFEPVLEEFYYRLKRKKNKLIEDKLSITQIFFKIKYSDFKVSTIDRKVSFEINEFLKSDHDEFKNEFYDSYLSLMKSLLERRFDPIRLLGLGVRFKEVENQQLSFDF